MQLIIISGRSGSGKSIALQALEDLGFYTIDNLPAIFLPTLLQQLAQNQLHQQRLAVCIDARNKPEMLQSMPALVKQLNQPTLSIQIIYLTAEPQQLLKRFAATRRRHPLTLNNQISLTEAIALEENSLTPIRNLADIIMDTTQLTVHELRERIERQLNHSDNQAMLLTLESFGFKYGVPLDADMILDARCLINPYWQPQLRDLTGQDQLVINYLQNDPLVKSMLSQTSHWLEQWLPHYYASQRSYFTLAIGCTGGQHRSVYLINQLASCLAHQYTPILIRHRELKLQRTLALD